MSPFVVVSVLAQREWRRLFRQPFRVAATVATPLIVLAALGAGFAGALSELSDAGYAGFLLPGMVAMAALFAGAFASMSLIEDRDSGLVLAVLAGPAPGWAVGLGKALGVGTLAVLQAGIVLLAAVVIGVNVGTAGWLGAAAGTVLLSAGAVGVSLAIAWRCPDTASFHAAMNLILLPGWMLAGAFYPADQAAPVMLWLTVANPLSWPIAAIRGSLTGETGLPGGPAWVWFGAVVFGLVGLLAASVAVRSSKG